MKSSRDGDFTQGNFILDHIAYLNQLVELQQIDLISEYLQSVENRLALLQDNQFNIDVLMAQLMTYPFDHYIEQFVLANKIKQSIECADALLLSQVTSDVKERTLTSEEIKLFQEISIGTFRRTEEQKGPHYYIENPDFEIQVNKFTSVIESQKERIRANEREGFITSKQFRALVEQSIPAAPVAKMNTPSFTAHEPEVCITPEQFRALVEQSIPVQMEADHPSSEEDEALRIAMERSMQDLRMTDDHMETVPSLPEEDEGLRIAMERSMQDLRMTDENSPSPRRNTGYPRFQFTGGEKESPDDKNVFRGPRFQ